MRALWNVALEAEDVAVVDQATRLLNRTHQVRLDTDSADRSIPMGRGDALRGLPYGILRMIRSTECSIRSTEYSTYFLACWL